jgi:aminopeptidase N
MYLSFRMRRTLPLLCLMLSPLAASEAQERQVFTRADTLRGSNTPQRAWWDVTFYDLHATITPSDSAVRGSNSITYDVLAPAQDMQIDLQAPLDIDSVVQDRQHLPFQRDGNAYFVALAAPQRAGDRRTLTVFYHGTYRAGGGPETSRESPFIWALDSLGAPWVATSDEEIGASAWWPLKDNQEDEPDSQRIAITVPDPLIDVSNGRLRRTTPNGDGTTTYEWFVTGPINGYDVAVNAAAHYVHFSDVYQGERGALTLDFWPLSYHRDTARAQFQQAQSMLACFEHWFGPYPWYEDGYKLIETPYLGMEHQSGIAYGNRYLQGYRGKDLSGTGLGMQWDFIIVHESAHEWWGNSISGKDHAEMWLHESFAMYSEGLYTECQQGKEAGERYLVGLRGRVKNDVPILGHYGVHHTPKSQDRYYKGSNMLLTIRQVIDDDAEWRNILRGLNQTFRHQTVWGRQIEDYISEQAGVDLSKVFAQYLTTTWIPVLEYRIAGKTLSYRWSNVVPGFEMPVRVTLTDRQPYTLIHPTETWQTVKLHLKRAGDFRVDERFYVTAKNAADTASRP